MKSKAVLGSPIERFTRMMFTRIIHRLARYLSDGSYTLSQVAALHLMGEREEISVKELSDELGLSISATSRLVDALVLRKLVDRVESAKDRRAKLLSLTLKGVNLLNEMSIERVAIIEETAATLPAVIPKKILSAVRLFK